ncbi:MAG: alpha-L-rhamnosidase C-terminal domain-containing protein [Victivallales bacterium]
MRHHRLFLDRNPFSDWTRKDFWSCADWPASWIVHPEGMTPPGAWIFQLQIELPQAAQIPLHVTADELYEFYIDGVRVGRGPERGEQLHWHYESYGVDLSAGTHQIMARVWAFGEKLGPRGLVGLQPGFLLAASKEFHERIATGVAPWMAKIEEGYSFVANDIGWGTGPEITVDASTLARSEKSNSWHPARTDRPGIDANLAFSTGRTHHLVPASLPDMIERPCRPARVRFIGASSDVPVDDSQHRSGDEHAWNGLLAGTPVHVPSHSIRRVILDNDAYVCAYPQLTVSGGNGTQVRLRWAESFFENKEQGRDPWPAKGNRDQINGKKFKGYGDTFLLDGERRTFTPPLWRPGRYLEFLVVTASQDVVIEDLTLLETHYPLEVKARFESSETSFQSIVPIAVRTLEMCMHQVYFDCPYYEQLMYIGDTRLQALVTYAMSGDDRLPRKAIRLFGHSLQSDGLTRSLFPGPLQTIAPFSLWWIGMLHDFARWRDDEVFVRAHLHAMRAILNAWSGYLNSDGLVESPRGWNFTDWVPHWNNGMPPEGEFGVSGILNLHFLLALRWCIELEENFGEPEFASRARLMSRQLFERICGAFWSDAHGLFADTRGHDCWSEHANSLAILSGMIDASRLEKIRKGLCERPDLARATVYFSHYLFSAYAECGLSDCLQNRLAYWSGLGSFGFRTTPEMPEPSRSDCHAWGAHPLYHFFASLLGVQPGMGFRSVTVRPQFGKLTAMTGRLPTPHGFIEFDLHRDTNSLSGRIVLPAGIAGSLRWGEQSRSWKGELIL